MALGSFAHIFKGNTSGLKKKKTSQKHALLCPSSVGRTIWYRVYVQGVFPYLIEKVA